VADALLAQAGDVRRVDLAVARAHAPVANM
jgi:hypothetical protein